MTVVKVGADFSVKLPDWAQEELPARPGDRIEFIPGPDGKCFILKDVGRAGQPRPKQKQD